MPEPSFQSSPSLVDKAQGTLGAVNSAISRTDGSYSPLGLVTKNGTRTQPGFTPNEFYDINPPTKLSMKGGASSDSWYGVLLETHPYFGSSDKFKSISTTDRFLRSKDLGSKSFTGPYTTRDYLLMFGDTKTDYFRHGLHIIDGKSIGDTVPANYNTPYENNDPVFFGFDIIIDAVSSPLLNGSVEDFIEQFSNVSEIAARRNVMKDFKIQFSKIFRTKGTPKKEEITQKTMSINIPNYANQKGQSNIYEGGKEAYLSYYIKKIAGLELLMISNTSNKKKYLTDYRNDLIKITTSEDVSLTMGTLAHLYRLLYWSKPNGKNLVPENLLRFNCDIVISECRNYNRVRKALDTGDLETIKENLSRYVYSLRECQLFFDTPMHDNEIDFEGIKDFVGTTITMDYKYVSSKFERWTPDDTNFGQYVSYNDGAIWKVGNPGGREAAAADANTGTIKDVSVPKFYSIGSNSSKQNGVSTAIVFDSFSKNTVKDEPLTKDKIAEQQGIDSTGATVTSGGSNETTNPEEGDTTDKNDKKAQRKQKVKEGLDAFKEASSKAALKLARELQTTVENEIKGQIEVRLRLLNNTLDKIRNATGVSRMRAPNNVYVTHPPHKGMDKERDGYPGVPGGTLPNYPSNADFSSLGSGGAPGMPSPSLFFDVQNSVRDFAGASLGSIFGDSLGSILSGRGGSGQVP